MATELRISVEFVDTSAPALDFGAMMGKPSKQAGEVFMRAQRTTTMMPDPSLGQSAQFALMRQRLASLVDDVRTDLDTQLETAESFPEATE